MDFIFCMALSHKRSKGQVAKYIYRKKKFRTLVIANIDLNQFKQKRELIIRITVCRQILDGLKCWALFCCSNNSLRSLNYSVMKIRCFVRKINLTKDD